MKLFLLEFKMLNYLIFGVFGVVFVLIPASAIAEATANTITPNNAPNNCQKVVTQILSDLKNYGRNLEQQPFPWKKLAWLEDNLGTDVQIETVTQKLYEWKNYKLLIDPDRGKMAIGDYPDKNRSGPPSPEEANIALGKPDNESSVTENKITWDCKNGSKLVIIADDNGNLLNVSVTVCNGSNCEGRVADLGTTKLNDEMNKSLNTAVDKAMGNIVADYNSHFQTNASTSDDVAKDMTSRLQGYYAKLRLCIPGTYQYGMPYLFNILYEESIIKGLENNKCSVETNFISPDNHNFNSKCQFQSDSLKQFTDDYAAAMIEGDETKISSPEMLQIMQTECLFFSDGKKTLYGNFLNGMAP